MRTYTHGGRAHWRVSTNVFPFIFLEYPPSAATHFGSRSTQARNILSSFCCTWVRHWKTADPKASLPWERLPARHFLQDEGTERKSLGANREDVVNFQFSPPRDSVLYELWRVCRCVIIMQQLDSPHSCIWLVGRFFILLHDNICLLKAKQLIRRKRAHCFVLSKSKSVHI